MLDFLRMLSLGDKVKDIIFEEEFILLRMVDTKNDQTFPIVTVENDQTPNIQDNIQQKPLIQNEELAPVHEEQTQQHQEQVPLRRFSREWRSMILNNYVIYL